MKAVPLEVLIFLVLLGLFLIEIQHKMLPSITCCCKGNKSLGLWHSLVSKLGLNLKLQGFAVRVNFSVFFMVLQLMQPSSFVSIPFPLCFPGH